MATRCAAMTDALVVTAVMSARSVGGWLWVWWWVATKWVYAPWKTSPAPRVSRVTTPGGLIVVVVVGCHTVMGCSPCVRTIVGAVVSVVRFSGVSGTQPCGSWKSAEAIMCWACGMRSSNAGFHRPASTMMGQHCGPLGEDVARKMGVVSVDEDRMDTWQ